MLVWQILENSESVSPMTCCFLSHSIMKFLVDHASDDGHNCDPLGKAVLFTSSIRPLFAKRVTIPETTFLEKKSNQLSKFANATLLARDLLSGRCPFLYRIDVPSFTG